MFFFVLFFFAGGVGEGLRPPTPDPRPPTPTHPKLARTHFRKTFRLEWSTQRTPVRAPFPQNPFRKQYTYIY